MNAARAKLLCMRLIAMTIAAMMCVPAQAQIPPPPMQPVDPMVADVSPLSVGLRDMQVDLRQPLGFKQVYRIPGSDGQVDQYMRASGAVYATFPLSAYRYTEDGVQVLIPAGTVFHIGAPWLVFGPPPGKQETSHEDEVDIERVLNRMNMDCPPTMMVAQPTGAFREDEQEVKDWSITPPMRHPWSLRLAAMNEEARREREDSREADLFDAADPPVPTIANDSIYRSRRIAALLQAAAAADRLNAREAPAADEPIAAPSQGS